MTLVEIPGRSSEGNELQFNKELSKTEPMAMNESKPLSQQSSHTSQRQFKPHWYRWVIMFFFINVSIVTSVCSSSLTPVADPLSAVFNVSPLSVTMTAIIFHITYIPMTFIAIKMFKDLKASLVFRIACVNLIFGGWVRTLA